MLKSPAVPAVKTYYAPAASAVTTYEDDIWERIPLLIHIGLAKTGTTWLTQKLFEDHDDEFVANANTPSMNALLLTPNDLKFIPLRARKELRSIAETAEREHKIAVLINEFILSTQYWHFASIPSNIARIRRTFPSAKLLITIREQANILYSSYSEYIRGGYSASLEDYLWRPGPDEPHNGVIDWDYYDYDHLYDICTLDAAPGSVTMVPFEWLMRDSVAATSYIMKELDLAFTPLAPEASNYQVRRAWSWPALMAARHANRFICRETRWVRKPLVDPMWLGNHVDRIVPSALRERMARSKRAYIVKQVGSYYAESNRRVSEKIGVDLRDFGYPVT